MKVTLDKVGKRFEREWIIRELSYTFKSGQAYAVLGPNGSGKSTLMQLIAGNLSVTSGSISYSDENSTISVDNIYKKISLVAPYLQLVEEFTLLEQLKFHGQFKPFIDGLVVSEVLSIIGLEKEANKEIRNFSSGMKQRVKLALAILSDTQIVLLDEPATNLDVKAVEWYIKLIEKHKSNRLILVSSNRPEEYSFCKEQLSISDFK